MGDDVIKSARISMKVGGWGHQADTVMHVLHAGWGADNPCSLGEQKANKRVRRGETEGGNKAIPLCGECVAR